MLQLKATIVVLLYCAGLALSGDTQLFPDDGSGIVDINEVIVVSPDGSSEVAVDINEAISDLITSSTTLLLQPGRHTLSVFRPIESLSDVTIAGNSSNGEAVNLTCNPTVGLAFVDIERLTIRDLTINGCGTIGENMATLSHLLFRYIRISPLYSLKNYTARAVVIARCIDLTIENVNIVNTQGVGLTGFNIRGNSTLRNVLFSRNTARELSQAETQAGLPVVSLGANAMLVFCEPSDSNATDLPITDLVIDGCQFKESASESPVTRHILADYFFNIRNFRDMHNGLYPLDGAAGLSLIFQHHGDSSQKIVVKNSNFSENSHPDGGCLLVMFQAQARNVSVSLDNLDFRECNGKNTGGGLMATYGYPNGDGKAIMSRSLSLVVQNTLFSDCSALWGAGAAVLSTPTFIQDKDERKIRFENCSWIDNTGIIGSALAIWESKYHGVQRQFGLSIELISCTFRNNRFVSEKIAQTNAAVVNLDAVSVDFLGENEFYDNQMSCIGATRSEIKISGHFIADNTQVVSGGVLDFRDTSFLIVRDDAELVFSNNQALWRGGAVSVKTFAPWPLTQFATCFLHFSAFHACPKPPCYDVTDYYSMDGKRSVFKVKFNNNHAALVGNEIFGADFHNCPWMDPEHTGSAELRFIQSNLSSVLVFSDDLITNDETINSYMNRAKFNNMSLPSTVMPGQEFEATVTLYDMFQQPVSDVSTLRLPLGNGTANVHGRFALDANIVTYIDESETIVFKFNGNEDEILDFQFFGIDAFEPIGNFNITLRKCKVGFSFDRNISECVFDAHLKGLHQSIVIHPNFSITRGQLRWIGHKNVSDRPERLYGMSLCVFDYCSATVSLLEDLSDESEQCSKNRTGILCGQCKENYSRILGSSECAICDNNTLSLLLFIIPSGVVIVALIFAFQISVASGYLNGPYLYASVISVFVTFVFPPDANPSLIILISALNLDIGFAVCFYDGMDQLAYTAFKFAYPFYLLLLIGIIALVAKCLPSKFLQAESLQIVQGTATILFISFNNLFQAAIEILSFAVVEYRGAENYTELHYGWLLDPNVNYGTGFHGFLVVVAALVLVGLLIPIMFTLIFFKQLLQVKYIDKLIHSIYPFLDAFQFPYVGKLRFWIGIQLLLRAIAIAVQCLQQLTSTETAGLRNFSVFFMMIVIGTFAVVQAFIRPYRGLVRNIVDLFFLLNLMYLLAMAVYYGILQISNQSDADREIVDIVHVVSAQIFLGLAFAVIIIIFAFFVLRRFGLIKLFVEKTIPKLPERVQPYLLVLLSESGYKLEMVRKTKARRKPESRLHSAPNTTVVEMRELDLTDGPGMESSYHRYRESILEHATTTLSRSAVSPFTINHIDNSNDSVHSSEL